MNHRSGINGFTLIELLSALAIVAFLSSIAIPSYQNTIQKTRRSDAITSLLAVQLDQAAFYALSGNYAASLDHLGRNSPTSADGFYQITMKLENPANTWLAIAEPLGGQGSDRCNRFAIDANGPVYNNGFATRKCWNR